MSPLRSLPSLEELYRGVLAGNRALLGRAITLVESRKAEHQEMARELLSRLLPASGKAWRVGITGVPGAGKSTLIESLGTWLTEHGHQMAVLAIDPTSGISGGSILGDKTRMNRLARDPKAFIRPSPNSGTLGGVARKTRESLLLCEAAGFDVVLVETVGVGQSESLVSEMVDCFLVLLLAGAGDELQGIKRGILELADILVLNKADGENEGPAKRAQAEFSSALRLLRSTSRVWKAPVLLASGLHGKGLPELWKTVERHRQTLEAAGELQERRQEQMSCWMWRAVEDQLLLKLKQAPEVAERLPSLEKQVREGSKLPSAGALEILQTFLGH